MIQSLPKLVDFITNLNHACEGSIANALVPKGVAPRDMLAQYAPRIALNLISMCIVSPAIPDTAKAGLLTHTQTEVLPAIPMNDLSFIFTDVGAVSASPGNQMHPEFC